MAPHDIVLFASFDTSEFKDPESNFINYDSQNELDILNTAPATLKYTVKPRSVSSYGVNFTSNGVDGFGTSIETFNIPKINFATQKIYFVARFKDGVIPLKREPIIENTLDFLITQDGNTIRPFNTDDNSLVLKENNLFFDLLSGGSIDSDTIPSKYVKFYTNYSSISALGGGYYKGYLTCSVSAKDCRIRMRYTNEAGTFNKDLTALSETFDIYPDSGVYDIRRKNEDHDQTASYKSMAYQEILQNQPFLFDNLLGTSVGNANDSVENIGIKTYEKIGNFVANNTDPDYCNINALISMFNNLDINFEDYNQQFPPSLTRLVDILSVSPSRQIKKNNQFQFNFDDRGFSSKLIFGKNKGEFLPIESTVLYIGDRSKYILAYEKFSEGYKLVNTNILSATNIDYIATDINNPDKSYALSGYNPSWGWGLVMPHDVTGETINEYYEFYDYDNTVDGTVIDDFIDYTNPNCTFLQSISSYGDLMDKDKIADNILIHNLISNCMLINSGGYTADNFKGHYMYDSDGNAFYASTYDQHLEYQALGYTHRQQTISNTSSVGTNNLNNSSSGSVY